MISLFVREFDLNSPECYVIPAFLTILTEGMVRRKCKHGIISIYAIFSYCKFHVMLIFVTGTILDDPLICKSE